MNVIELPVKIHNLIAHKIYHKTTDMAGLYDMEASFDAELEDILRKQIIENCNYKYTHSAVFDTEVSDPDGFRELCNRLYENPADFVARSQQMAQRLFKASTKNSSESDLLICTFSQGGKQNEKWLALLKMEPQSGIMQDEKKQGGKKIPLLTLIKNVLPTGYLQKCAFIAPFSKKAGKNAPDLYVLDLQSGKYGAQKVEVASFFTKTFLQCRIDKSQTDLTNIFFRGSHDWISKKREVWQEREVVNFELAVENAVRGNQVDLESFAQSVISDPNEQENYLDFLMDKKGMSASVFTPDPAKRDDLLRYSWFEGDNGLLLKVESEAISDMIKEEKSEGRPYKITITTATWNKKYKK